MSRVRPFVPGDIPDVAALRSRSFEFSTHQDSVSLAAYLADVFFDGPWNDGGSPSLVYLNDEGRIAGFLGVVHRPATFRGERIRIAVCTQFMVDPEHRGLAGVQLVRRLFEGNHDLSFADVANDTSRTLWERLGGSTAAVNSLTWTQTIRPMRFRITDAHYSIVSRGIAWSLRPLFEFIDSARSPWPNPEGLDTVPLTPETMADKLPEVLSSTALLPVYSAESARWLLDQLALKRERGAARGVAVVDRGGTTIGWYIYLANRRGVGDVVQVVAAEGQHAAVLAALFHDARAQGLTALEGRASFGIVAALDPELARVRREGPWVLAQSRRPEIVDAITSGDALLSRLEGEWWMSF
jgi:hypothetical protein